MHIAAGRYWRESWSLSTAYNKFLSKSSFAFCIKILDIFPVSTRDWSRATVISENHLMSPTMVEVKGNLCYMEISPLKSPRSLGQPFPPWSTWRDITRFWFNILWQPGLSSCFLSSLGYLWMTMEVKTEPEKSKTSKQLAFYQDCQNILPEVPSKAWPREQFLLQRTTRKMLGGVILKKRWKLFCFIFTTWSLNWNWGWTYFVFVIQAMLAWS